jgi:hypothetical protein
MLDTSQPLPTAARQIADPELSAMDWVDEGFAPTQESIAPYY